MDFFPEEIIESYLKIDKRQIQHLVYGNGQEITEISVENTEYISSVENFFNSIMFETETIIFYSRILKFLNINDKKSSRRIRVTGAQKGIKAAEKLIKKRLNSNIYRMGIIIDISWTQHSYILRKKGKIIHQIKKQLGLDIYSSNKNKTSDNRKSNSIYISGDYNQIYDVERAHNQIRSMTPLTYEFDLPIPTERIYINLYELCHGYSKKYKVKIGMVYPEVNCPFYKCCVRGRAWNALNVKAATLDIIRAICGRNASEILVQIKLEMITVRQGSMFGPNNEIIMQIMGETSTSITLSKNPTQRTTTIFICGSVEGVDLARLSIIGCSPIKFSFHLHEHPHLNPIEMNQLAEALDVNIFIKQINNDGKVLVSIKTPERNVGNIYKAWDIITRSLPEVQETCIPFPYHMMDDFKRYQLSQEILKMWRMKQQANRFLFSNSISGYTLPLYPLPNNLNDTFINY